MPSPEEIEEKIKEKRIIEANKKGFLGPNSKIKLILKIFGDPIISQSENGGYVDTNYMDLHGYELPEEEILNNIDLLKKIPIMELDNNTRPNSEEWTDMPDSKNYSTETIGYHFDGLSRGMHMEIKYDEFSTETIISYKGYVCYREAKGELLSYIPNNEWEKWIESLYKVAKEKQRVIKEKEFEESIKEKEKEKENWINKIISNWGTK